jgi:hypothetical protein
MRLETQPHKRVRNFPVKELKDIQPPSSQDATCMQDGKSNQNVFTI